ncbi:MAG: 4Fe-4S dicluster domain-containing protein [Candidatus Brocadiia bacterium]
MAKNKKTGAVVVDLERCLACRACETACAMAHGGFEDIVEAVLADAHMVPRVRVIAAGSRAVPVQCQHCQDAPCVTVCPSGALYREEEGGPVLTAPEKCIGCKSCVVVCPFGSLQWDAEGRTVLKCDLCAGLIQEGEPPHCVVACPTGARQVMALEDLVDQRRRDSARRTIAVTQAHAESAEE